MISELNEDISINQYKSSNDWILWDEFCKNNKYVSFLSLSSWLGAYDRVPFVKKVLFLIREKDSELIIGGISGLTVGIGKFKVLIFPSGPFVNSDKINAEVYSKLLIDFLSKVNCKIYLNTGITFEPKGFVQKKWRIRGIYTNPGIGMIDTSPMDFETILKNMKSSTRRDIRASYRKELEVHEIKDVRELKTLHAQFEENSKRNGYKIKPFWWYRSMWRDQLRNGTSRFFCACKDNEIKGAIWVIKCGGAYNYIMGSSKREAKDLMVGYRMQSEIIRLSVEERLDYYNISIGGPRGVEQFKDDFGRQKVKLTKRYVSFFNK